jgi:hypothetical protein
MAFRLAVDARPWAWQSPFVYVGFTAQLLIVGTCLIPMPMQILFLAYGNFAMHISLVAADSLNSDWAPAAAWLPMHIHFMRGFSMASAGGLRWRLLIEPLQDWSVSVQAGPVFSRATRFD